MVKLQTNEIIDMLKKAKYFLKKDNIKFVTIDVDAYKQGKGFIDWSTQQLYDR